MLEVVGGLLFVLGLFGCAFMQGFLWVLLAGMVLLILALAKENSR